jgi:hypothetical protein
MLRYHGPFGDHGVGHLARVLCAGDLINLHRDFLADNVFQLRGLGVAGDDQLEVSGPVSRLQAPPGGGSRRGSLVI